MEVKEVIFYVISRLNFHRIDYEVYNAKTGSTYIRVGKDRIRISDHPGEYDDYNYIIRTDCKKPVQVDGKVAVPAELTDYIINRIIQKYRKTESIATENQYLSLLKNVSYDSIKKMDIGLLYKIVKYDKHKEPPISKYQCYKRIMRNKSLIKEYFDSVNLGEDNV